MTKLSEDYLPRVLLEDITTASGMPIPSRKAIINPTTKKSIEIVSDRYGIVQNEEMLEAIIPAVKKVGLSTRANIRTTKGGAVTFFSFMAKSNDTDFNIDITPGDTVQFGIEFFNSYDKSLKAGYHVIAVRALGDSLLVVPESRTELAIKHVGKAAAKIVIDDIDTLSPNRFAARWQSWQETMITKNDARTFLTETVGKKVMHELFEEFQNLIADKRNVWELYNILTCYVTHKLTTRKDDLHEYRMFQLGESITNKMAGFFNFN
jgi:hypothetical protein